MGTRGGWDTAGRWGFDVALQVMATLVFLVVPALLARLIAVFV